MDIKEQARLTDEEIKIAQAEAERLSWTHKPHPSFERQKYLLDVQLEKALPIGIKEGRRQVIGWVKLHYPDLPCSDLDAQVEKWEEIDENKA